MQLYCFWSFCKIFICKRRFVFLVTSMPSTTRLDQCGRTAHIFLFRLRPVGRSVGFAIHRLATSASFIINVRALTGECLLTRNCIDDDEELLKRQRLSVLRGNRSKFRSSNKGNELTRQKHALCIWRHSFRNSKWVLEKVACGSAEHINSIALATWLPPCRCVPHQYLQ